MSQHLKEALDLLLEAYTPNATLNDINIILSLVLAKEHKETGAENDSEE